MSMRTLPLVFINLGGEMLYILDQRLHAHSTSEEKSEKVMNDIVGTMFSQAFMDEILKPQLLYSHRTMKVVLTRLAHVSIMKLNAVSMEKLYELMLMAFKYQVFLCPRPKDLLLISYNHIDTIRGFVKDTPAVLNKVDETHRKIIEIYSSMTAGEFQLLRQTLLTFLQDTHIRVSIFLKNKIQNPNGHFALSTSGPVPHGMDVPGVIRYSVNLGGESSKVPSVKMDASPNPLAKEELNLLACLMGTVEIENASSCETGFQINLLASAQEEEEGGASGGADESFEVINIQALKAVMESESTEDPLSSQAESFSSIRERTIAENSMVVLLQGLRGEVTTVDLRNESTARGRVINVDAFMNVRLEEVLYRDPKGRLTKLQDLFITGRNIRYVHIPDHMDIMKTIQGQLAKIHRVRNFAKEGGGRKEYGKKTN